MTSTTFRIESPFPLANCRKFYFSKIAGGSATRDFFEIPVGSARLLEHNEGNLVGRKQDSGSQTVGALTLKKQQQIRYSVDSISTVYSFAISFEYPTLLIGIEP